MPKALADSKAADRKKFNATHRPPPKHEPKRFSPDPKDPFGVAAKAAGKTVDADTGRVVESDHGKSAATTGASNMTEDVKTPTKQEQAEAAAKAKMADKEAKLKAAAEAKTARDKKLADEKEAKAKAKEVKDAERATAREAKDAERAAQLSGTNRKYTGPMLALAEKVKAGVYVKGAHGQLRSNDELAIALDMVPPAKLVLLAKEVLGEAENRYAALNIGQQSMNYRNRLRGAIKAGKVKLENGTEKPVTLDLIKKVRDDNGYAVEPEVKAPKATVKPAAEAKPDAAPATEGAKPEEAKPAKGKKTKAPAVSAAGASVGLPQA